MSHKEKKNKIMIFFQLKRKKKQKLNKPNRAESTSFCRKNLESKTFVEWKTKVELNLAKKEGKKENFCSIVKFLI